MFHGLTSPSRVTIVFHMVAHTGQGLQYFARLFGT